jgi:hypothetical protein
VGTSPPGSLSKKEGEPGGEVPTAGEHAKHS